MGGVILILSFLTPRLLTTSEWMDQLNIPDDPTQLETNIFLDFEPGDTVYLEGEIIDFRHYSAHDIYFVEVGDSEYSYYFLTELNISRYNINESLYFKIEIRGPGTVEGSSDILGYSKYNSYEDPILVDIQKEHVSHKFIYMISGLFLMLMGTLLTFYWVRSKSKLNKSKYEEHEEKS